MNKKAELIHKIETRQARLAVVGLGYVGLPLAVAFAQAGFTVVGVDIDARKTDAVNIVESGSHEELLALNGRYARSCRGGRKSAALEERGRRRPMAR